MVFTKEVKVGILATITSTMLYIGFNYLKGKEIYPTHHTYYTTYSNVKGLTTTDQVKINGLQVGKIRQIEILPEQEYQVRVTLAIEKHIKLTHNTVARLESANLIVGTKAIELIIKEGELLKNHGSLPSEIEQDLTTQVATSTLHVTESTLDTIEDAKVLASLMHKIMQNFVEKTDSINAIFTNLEKVSEQLQKTIYINQQDFTSISRNIAAISSSFSNEETGIQPILVNINYLLQEATTWKVREIITNLNNIVTKLEKGSLYNNIDQTIVDLDNLIVDLQTHPHRYINFSIFGGNSIFSKRKKKTRQLLATSQPLQPTPPSKMTKKRIKNKT